MAKIVYSKDDLGGSNIARLLKEKHGFSERFSLEEKGKTFQCWRNGAHALVEFEGSLVLADWLADFPSTFSTELLIFASKHESEKGTPCLTAHPTGNFGKPSIHGEKALGGSEATLSKTSSKALRAAMDFLRSHSVNGFQVTREATHHGPTNLPWPTMFVEVGSSAKEWAIEEACNTVAQAILHSANNYSRADFKTAIGFGGPHYCPAFNDFEAENPGVALSHICAKYALENLNENLFQQMIEKTVERVELVLLDRKGIAKVYKDQICAWAEKSGLAVEKV